MIRFLGWQEWQDRALLTPQGAVAVQKGEFVMVIVASEPSEALAATQHLLASKQGDPSDG